MKAIDKGNKAGSHTTTAPLSAKTAKSILSSLKGDNDKKSLLLFGLGFYTGFRIGDILNLTWNDVRSEKIETKEQKTSKRRLVTINTELQKIIKFCDNGQDGENFIFVGERHHTGKPMTVTGANKRIKSIFDRYGIETENASSHTLRKTFAYGVYTQLGKTDEALMTVSKLLNHSNTGVTRDYLGITATVLSDCYINLKF